MKKYKYAGVLKGFDFKKINKNNFQLLIEKQLFDVNELSETYKGLGNYFGLELEEVDLNFSDFFLFNGKEYLLKKDIYLEMYNFKNEFIEDWNEIDSVYNEINLGIEREFQTENKLKVIEKYYNEYFSIVKNSDYYLLFKDGNKTGGYNSWLEYFISNIVDEEDFTSVENYLKGNLPFFLNPQINKDWDSFYIISKVCDYCIRKKIEIENPKKEKLIIEEDLMIKNYKIDTMDTSKQVALLEAIIASGRWGHLSASKKGEIASYLLGKNKDNIKKVYLEFDKPFPQMSQKTQDDKKEIENLFGKYF